MQPSDDTPEPSSETADLPDAKKDKKARIKRMRERARCMMQNSVENDLRKKMIEDLNFVHVPGEQWDEFTKRARGDDRPMYQFNRTRVTIKRIVNNMRANRPQGKVRGYEDNDKDTADIYEGQIRNIANLSDFDSITDNAAEYQVAGGYAAWRICTKYAEDSVSDQDILFESIRNPLCLYCDEEAFEQTGADARDWLFTDKLSAATYKAKYPKADPVSFDDETFDDDDDWDSDDKVRIAEYWWKEPYDKTVHLLSDGETIDDSELAEAQGRGLKVLKSRTFKSHKIMSATYSGNAELTEPTEFAGPNHPWIRVYGEYICIEGRVHWCGLTRHVKDAQRGHNVGMTSAYEAVARASVAQIWATPTQANGLAEEWAKADKKNQPHQLYNPDPAAPGPPQRVQGAEVPVAFIQMANMGAEEIKANSGIFDASLGNKSNETSGVALRAREAQGEIATFNYQDNMAKAVKRTWQIAIGMIPIIYDTERSLRILGADGSEKFIKVNQPDAQGNTLNDLSRGKYDVTVTVGPSFATQRQEAAETYASMAQSDQMLMPTAGDLVYKALDLPYAEEISERRKMMLPPPILNSINKDTKQPPEVQQAMMQADQAMQQVQEQGKMVQAAAAEATQLKTEAEQAQGKVQIQIATLKTEEAKFQTMQAQFETKVAQFETMMAQAKAEIEQGQAQADTTNGENSAALEQIMQAAQALQMQSDAFLQQAAQVVMAAKQEDPIVIEKPRPTGMRTKRVNGELVGEVTYDDGTAKQVKASRVNGEMVGSIQ